MAGTTNIPMGLLMIASGFGLLRATDFPSPDDGEEGDAVGAMIATEEPGAPTAWTTAVEPKPLSEEVKQGLAWLLRHQLESGGWGQGEEAPGMRASGKEGQGRANVADTCMAALAILRAGGSPEAGEYAEPLQRAVAFVCGEVEEADDESLWVTSIRGTRVQGKIGTYVDTFLASMLLSEVQGAMGDPGRDVRVERALARVLDKIERHQNESGTWSGSGWAPVLSQSLAVKGINRAVQRGLVVSESSLRKAEEYFGNTAYVADYSVAAGVPLYALSAQVGALQESANTDRIEEVELQEELAVAEDDAARASIAQDLRRIEASRGVQAQVQESLLGRLDDPSFVAGFGSNGGEEFLSYMNISESLVLRADDEWRRWDAAMTANLSRVQNEDGSWTGHHCITGRTFCTATALLVLTADRTPVPVEAITAVEPGPEKPEPFDCGGVVQPEPLPQVFEGGGVLPLVSEPGPSDCPGMLR